MNEFQLVLDTTKEHMQKSIDHLIKAFVQIRAGKASPAMLNSVLVSYYGNATPLSQVANINTPDAMTLSIQPWERTILGEIEKAIMNANLGFNPMNNGENIIISVPPLTEERRKDLVKQAKTELEEAKVGIRNARKEANAELKKIENISEDLIKNGEEQVQKMTDQYSKKAESLLVEKEKEIMTV